jgi:hypothetical protein
MALVSGLIKKSIDTTEKRKSEKFANGTDKRGNF